MFWYQGKNGLIWEAISSTLERVNTPHFSIHFSVVKISFSRWMNGSYMHHLLSVANLLLHVTFAVAVGSYMHCSNKKITKLTRVEDIFNDKLKWTLNNYSFTVIKHLNAFYQDMHSHMFLNSVQPNLHITQLMDVKSSFPCFEKIICITEKHFKIWIHG